MIDALATMQPLHFLGAGLGVGIVALVLSLLGTARRSALRALSVPFLAALGGLALCASLWFIAPYVPKFLTRAHPRTCAEARALGHGTARIGEPGYFRHLDADGDGYSCEPMPGSRWAR